MMTAKDDLDAGLAALRMRDMARAATLLRAAAAAIAPAQMSWPALAQAELALGNRTAAEDAIDRQLALATRDVGALLLKGYLREQGGDERAAASFYRTALNQGAISGIPQALAALARKAEAFLETVDDRFAAHLLAQVEGRVSPRMAEAIELLTGKRQIDLQRPSVFYYPGLPQRRFWEVDEFPWLQPMLDRLPAMQAELAEVLASETPETFAPYVTGSKARPAPNNPLYQDPSWGAFYFWKDGAMQDEAARRCPATMAALEHAPLPRIPGRAPTVLWSRLKPGTHIAPHYGMLNTRLICHLPIRTAPECTLRVGSETRSWLPGVPLIFDDSMEHEARNAGAEERVVLLFEIWRPEIGDEDRAAISRIFQAIDGYGSGG